MARNRIRVAEVLVFRNERDARREGFEMTAVAEGGGIAGGEEEAVAAPAAATGGVKRGGKVVRGGCADWEKGSGYG